MFELWQVEFKYEETDWGWIKEFCQPFKLSNDILCDIVKRLTTAINQGLSKDTYKSAAVKCFVTYVQELPTGNETGNYLAIDLGGANFRILLITLGPERKAKMDSRIYAFPDEKMTGSAEEFFDYIAECVEMFKSAIKKENEEFLLGFCFGFPVEIQGLNKGILTQWAKRFHVKGVVGKDVVALLQTALDKKQLKVKVTAIVNDTVGCLMSCAWLNPNCRIGVIIGTGTNACYMEKIENVEKYEDKSKPYMVINTEWGNFGADGSLNDILTEQDRQLDRASLRQGTEIYEKMVSVMYLCELIRMCILKCAEQKYLFQGEVPEKLKDKRTFLPEFMYDIEKDSVELKTTMRILEETLEIHSVSNLDCVNVKYIIKTICQRSAYLLSAALCTLITKINVSPITIAIDGGMYRNHPTYKDMLQEKIRCMINPSIQFDMMLSQDGGGKGTAIVTAATKAGK